MKYCCYCRAVLIYEIPADDNRHRYICQSCDTIHYQNPKIVAGCIPVWEDKILLCKRAIEPRYGYWTLPAGFMELGETSLEAGIRETLEEANARVDVEELFAVFSLPHVGQVYMMFRSRLIDLNFSPGAESLDVKLFKEADIPWNELAFTTIRASLRCYFEDIKQGAFSLHTGDIVKTEAGYDFVPTLI
ncbi:MAG: NUDIX hydrolase [Proteobacteria bacterium]|nr:NUDIX domain-containing protein [Pseudomonadota bacterium]NOG61027.1 NUDIX hydrolase [Pseudomonadota bacterium]